MTEWMFNDTPVRYGVSDNGVGMKGLNKLPV